MNLAAKAAVGFAGLAESIPFFEDTPSLRQRVRLGEKTIPVGARKFQKNQTGIALSAGLQQNEFEISLSKAPMLKTLNVLAWRISLVYAGIVASRISLSSKPVAKLIPAPSTF